MDAPALLLALLVLLFVSLNANVVQLLLLRKKRKTALTTDAKELLRDLASSSAVLRIQILDQGDFFLKSPRG